MCDADSLALTKLSVCQGDHNFSEHDIDAAKVYCEFMYNSIVETVNLIKQGAIYYFLIMAATNSFLLSSAASNVDRGLVMRVTIMISICFVIIMVSVAWGILTGLVQLSRSYQLLNKEMYIYLKVDSYLKRGMIVGGIIVMMCITILAVLVYGFYWQS